MSDTEHVLLAPDDGALVERLRRMFPRQWFTAKMSGLRRAKLHELADAGLIEEAKVWGGFTFRARKGR